MKKKLLIIFCFLSCVITYAQDTLHLSLEQFKDLNSKKNLSIIQNQIEYKLAKASFYSSIGKSLPMIGIGIKRYEINGYTQNTTGEFIDVEKNQEWTGKSLKIVWKLDDLLFNSISFGYKNKAALYKRRSKDVDDNIHAYTLYFILSGSYEKEYAIKGFIKKNTEIVKQLQIQVSNGLRLQSELLLAKTNLNNLKIKLLQQEQITTEYNQKLLEVLNIKKNLIISTNYDLFSYHHSNNQKIINVEAILNNRFESKQLEKELLAVMWKKNKELYGLLIPEISFGINDGLVGPINQDVFGSQNILASSLMWNIPIEKIFPYGNINQQKHKYQLKKIQKKQLENKIRKELKIIVSSYKSANKQYVLAKEAVEFAKLAYQQSLKRQNLGTANQLELFHAEHEYLNAQLIYISSLVKILEIENKKIAVTNTKTFY